MKRFVATACLAGLLTSTPLLAADERPARTVTVSGEAEIRVAPDEVLVTLGVETRNKDLNETMRLSDRRIEEILAAALALGIARADIRTDYLNLQPEYDDAAHRSRSLVGYLRRTTVVVTLRDVSKFGALLTSVLKAGVEYVHGIDFRCSELRKHRDAARLLAIKAAQEKAVAMAGALGQKVGRPTAIQDAGGGWWSSYWSSYSGWWGGSYQGRSQNVVQYAAGSSTSQDGLLAPGTVSIQASVTVSFEIE